MGVSDLYGPADDAESVATIRAALDAGVTLFDTGDFYGVGHNQLLLRDAIQGRRREDAQSSVKFGLLRDARGGWTGVDARPVAIKNFLAYTLRRLGTDYVDIYRPARLDPSVPAEETMGAPAQLVKQGLVRHTGLSEVGADTLRRAHAEHPVSDLQIEYSLISRGIKADILPTARELGVGITAYGSGGWRAANRRQAQTDLSAYHVAMTPAASRTPQTVRTPAGQARDRTPVGQARDRILATAFRLFYARGLRAAGVDTIIAESDVAKATFYKYFPAKDELILAYLDTVDGVWTGQLHAAAEAAGPDPADQLVGLFDALASACRRDGYRGCAFINAAVESAPGTRVHERTVAHKQHIRAWIRGLAVLAGARDPDQLARSLTLLLDGGLASGVLDADPEAATSARTTASLLVAAAAGRSPASQP